MSYRTLQVPGALLKKLRCYEKVCLYYLCNIPENDASYFLLIREGRN